MYTFNQQQIQNLQLQRTDNMIPFQHTRDSALKDTGIHGVLDTIPGDTEGGLVCLGLYLHDWKDNAPFPWWQHPESWIFLDLQGGVYSVNLYWSWLQFAAANWKPRIFCRWENPIFPQPGSVSSSRVFWKQSKVISAAVTIRAFTRVCMEVAGMKGRRATIIPRGLLRQEPWLLTGHGGLTPPYFTFGSHVH